MADRPACEDIEITPEMIEAGAEVMWNWVVDRGYDDTATVDDMKEPTGLILKASVLRYSPS